MHDRQFQEQLFIGDHLKLTQLEKDLLRQKLFGEELKENQPAEYDRDPNGNLIDDAGQII